MNLNSKIIIILFLVVSLNGYAQSNYIQICSNQIVFINEYVFNASNLNNSSFINAPIKQNRLDFNSNVSFTHTNNSKYFTRTSFHFNNINSKYYYKYNINRSRRDSSSSVAKTIQKEFGLSLDFGKEINIQKLRFIAGIRMGYSMNFKPLQIVNYYDYKLDTLSAFRSIEEKNTQNIFHYANIGLVLGIHYKFKSGIFIGGELNQNLLFSFKKGRNQYITNNYNVKTNELLSSDTKTDKFTTNNFELNTLKPLISITIGLTFNYRGKT